MFASLARQISRLKGDRRGGAAIEAALCFPILTVMLFGVFWFGWSQHRSSTMRYALHGATRALVLNPDLTQSELQSLVRAQMGVESNLVNVTLAVADVTGGRRATVTGTYTSVIKVPITGNLTIDNSATVKAFLPIT